MTPKEESEVLLHEMKVSAEKLLADHGEFHPFGGMIRRDGQVVLTNVDSGEEFPRGNEVVNMLADAFRQKASKGELRAAAIVANVKVSPPGQSEQGDAIRISLDHEGDYSVHVFFPYQLAGKQQLSVDRPFATRGRSFAFRGEPFPV